MPDRLVKGSNKALFIMNIADATPTEPWLSLLQISGADRVSFLQGQLTADIRRLGVDANALLAAQCDAKGRVLAVLTLFAADEKIYAAIRTALADEFITSLMRYRFRAKVEITPCVDVRLLAFATTAITQSEHKMLVPSRLNDHDGFVTGEIIELIEHADTPIDTTKHKPLDDEAWSLARVKAGISEPTLISRGQFTPHMLNLDRIGAVSFAKGCYTGQEIVARTEHLGSAKRRTHLIKRIDGELIDGSDAVYIDGKKAGAIVCTAQDHALAVLRIGADDTTATLGESGPRLRIHSLLGD